jgi:hypothetical protein
MSRRLAVAVLFLSSLAAAPAAAGDGPMPFAQQGGSGVLSVDGRTRWITVGTAQETVLELVDTAGGAVQRFADLPGAWGVPMVTGYQVDGAGLSSDGKTLVLGDVVPVFPRTTSGFLVIDTATLLVRHTIELKGDFAFDALSPDASRLYLIQHVDQNDTSKYVVRAYDVTHHTLLPGRIADRTQKGWVMKGYPVSRTTSADGRMVYTLYQNPGGFAFVHALDTVRGVAHCVGIPWRGSQNGFYNLRLSLRDRDRTLAVHWLSGRPWFAVNTSSWSVSVDRRAGFPLVAAAIGVSVAAMLIAVALLLLRRRRRRSEEFEQELVDLLRLPEREVVI